MLEPEPELVGRAFPLACWFRFSDETVDARFRGTPAMPRCFMDTMRMSNGLWLNGDAGRAADDDRRARRPRFIVIAIVRGRIML